MKITKSTLIGLFVGLQVFIIVGMVAKKQSVLYFGKTIILKTEPVDPHTLFRGDYARLAFSINRPEVKDSTKPPYKRGDLIYAELKEGEGEWVLAELHKDFPLELDANHVVLRGKVNKVVTWKGQRIKKLQDVSHPGWLATQSSTASWRQRWWGGIRSGLYWNRKILPGGTKIYLDVRSYGRDFWYVAKMAENKNFNKNSFYDSEFVVLSGTLGPYEEKTHLRVDYGIETYFVPEGKGHDYEKPGLEVEIVVNKKGSSVVKTIRGITPK